MQFLLNYLLICIVAVSEISSDLKTSLPTGAAQKLKWVPISNAYVSHLIPAGYEYNRICYIARAQIDGEWIPGKASSLDGTNFFAYVSYKGEEIGDITDFQVLLAPPGSTSWVETHDDFVPPLPIFGGTDPETGESTFVCRGTINDRLIPGKLLPSKGACFIPNYDEKNVTTYEVLVTNAYGEFIGS